MGWIAGLARRAGRNLSEDNYGDLYKAAQRLCWAGVRRTGSAKTWFEEFGFSFVTTKSGAPAVDIPHVRRMHKEIDLELDHRTPKASAWQKALDADNLQFLTGWDNWLLNEIERLGPELGRGQGHTHR
jgi:hypothetical protein